MKFTVQDEVNARLDNLIAEKLNTFSRSHIKQLISKNFVKVNSETAKASYIPKTGDIISIDNQIISQIIPQVSIPVIYEDEDCIVINKPTGLLSHSKGDINLEATVESWLADYITDIKGDRAGIVHRLDRQTSGVMICAKNIKSYLWLQKQFSTRKVKKQYIAIVNGHMNPDEAIIDMPIARNPKKPSSFRVDPKGKSANTRYRVLKRGKKFDMVELSPTTGRTHQLRVHLLKVGHPILGDSLYGNINSDRLMLHAHELDIVLPNGKNNHFVAKLPSEFNKRMIHDD